MQSYSQISLHLARRISARECSADHLSCATCPHTGGELQAVWISTDWDEAAATATLRRPPATNWQPADRSMGVVGHPTYGGENLDATIVLYTNDLPASRSPTQLGIELTSISGGVDATFTSREADGTSCDPVVEPPTAIAICM